MDLGDPPSYLVDLGDPPSLVDIGDPPSSLVDLGDPPSYLVYLGDPPSSLVDLGDPPSSLVDLGDPPSSLVDLGDPPSSLLDLGDPPSSLVDLGDSSSSLVGQKKKLDLSGPHKKRTARKIKKITRRGTPIHHHRKTPKKREEHIPGKFVVSELCCSCASCVILHYMDPFHFYTFDYIFGKAKHTLFSCTLFN